VTPLLVAAWTVFGLDLIVLALMGHDLAFARAGPTGQTLMLAFTIVMAAIAAVVGIVLAIGTWRRSRVGLWIGLVFGALPLLWVAGALTQSWRD
jgi:hypothetical protein